MRGPTDQPIVVRSFSDFQQHFGGLWQPSPLSYAVEHFFEQGGRQAVIVRVANGARPATVSLRCERAVLQLQARAPGTREFLRASVDYDNVPQADAQRFNLVVQRVRSPGSERIEAQETFRDLSVDPAAPRFITAALLGSALVRVRGDVPRVRPDRTLMAGTNLPVGYVSSNPDGDDGGPLTPYDVVGSQTKRTGLFALSDVDELAFLYLPPLSRTQDVSISALLVAAGFCRERRAILIIDPPAAWDGVSDVSQAARSFSLHSDHAVMFYPRIVAMDRLRGRLETFGNGGAVAGLLSRSGESVSAVATAQAPEPLLRAHARLAREVSARERWLLSARGVNVLQTVRSPEPDRSALRTLACGASSSSDGSYLARRRFVLFVVNAIVRGTRWAQGVGADADAWPRLTRQVRAFLEELRIVGAFGPASRDQAYLVICDGRVNDLSVTPARINVLVQFAGARAGGYHSFMITHSITGVRVRPVAVNRLGAALLVGDALEQELTIRLDPEESRAALIA